MILLWQGKEIKAQKTKSGNYRDLWGNMVGECELPKGTTGCHQVLESQKEYQGCLVGRNHKAWKMDSKETPKWLERRAPLTRSALACVFPNFSPEFFSNLTFQCLHGTFLRCHLKANQGHQIPLSTQEDVCDSWASLPADSQGPLLYKSKFVNPRVSASFS